MNKTDNHYQKTDNHNQKEKALSIYTDYIKYLLDKGYTRENINLDETSEIVTTFSLAKGAIGPVLDIRCPSRYKIIIVGKNQLPEDADVRNVHALIVRFADSNNDEVTPYTRIKISKERISGDITTIATMLYKDITITDYQKKLPNKIKSDDKWYTFDQGIELNGEEHIKIHAIDPNIEIDAKNVKLSLDIDLWEGE